MIKNLLSKYYQQVVFLILLLSFILRFFNYENRWGLAYDQAHDALVARYAVENLKLPLVGPFSSGAQFQTSGIWYWLLMLATLLYRNSIITPWIIITIISLIFIWLMIIVGNELVDKEFGLLAGLLSSVSTAQIAQSTNLTLTAPMAVISLLIIFSMIKYIKTKNYRYIFLLGFFTALAPTIHLQGVVLIIFSIITFIYLRHLDIKAYILFFIGLFLPLTPLIIFDLQNNFVNISGLVNYILFVQYRISYEELGRRWLTYLGVFWPASWARIIGGEVILGYATILSLITFSFYRMVKKQLTKEWLIIMSSFAIFILGLRYVRTPLFDSYLVFLHPFILFLTTWLLLQFKRKNLIIFIFVLLIVIFASLRIDILEIKNSGNSTAKLSQDWRELILNKFPGKKFAVYDHDYKSAGLSLPIVLYLYEQDKIANDGIKIGFSNIIEASSSGLVKVLNGPGGLNLYQLNKSTSNLVKDRWVSVNPSSIYQSTEEWNFY
ncbi:MAG: glycosyltransferase family 39 protein [Candidatus Gottesmanbacteria bacterium]